MNLKERVQMTTSKDFRELIVWQRAMELAGLVYRLTMRMPKSEMFGLVAQMRRAAVSIPSNIAEGNARQSLRDYVHFLTMARGSLAELETQIIIASDLAMIRDSQPLLSLLSETTRILQGLIQS